MLAAELVTSTLNTSPLESLLQQLLSAVSSTQSDLHSLSIKHDSQVQFTLSEFQLLKSAHSADQTRLKDNEEIKKALTKIDVWSDRFTALETKYFTLAEEVYTRLEDIQKELNVKFIDAESESERTAKVLRRELRTHIQDYEENIDQIRLNLEEIAEFSHNQKFPSLLEGNREKIEGKTGHFDRATSYKDPISSQTEIKFPSITIEKAPEAVFPATSEALSVLQETDSGLSQLITLLENRLAVVERKLDMRLPRKSTLRMQNTGEDGVTPQIQGLGAVEERLKTLEMKPEPEKVDLGPLMLRVTALENARKRVEPPSRPVPKDTLGEVNPPDFMSRTEITAKLLEFQSQLDQKLSSVSLQSPGKSAFEAEIRSVVESLREELNSVKRKIVELHRPQIQMGVTPKASERATAQSVVQTPEKQIQGKLSSALFNWDTTSTLEPRVTALSKEIEKLHGLLDTKVKEIEEIDQHVERTERLVQSHIDRLQLDFERKFATLEEILDRPAGDAEATKNLASLRGVISKLQKEFKTLASTVTGIQVPAPTATSDGDTVTKPVLAILQRQEGQIRSLEAGLRQVSKEMETLAPSLRRQLESADADRIYDMEKLKENVDMVLGKIKDGARLNKRDFDYIKDMYDKIDQKADKADLPQKVDRLELQKAYVKLAKKLEEYREEAQKKEVVTVQPQGKEEAAGTFRRIDVGCLSCGQEVAGETETRNITPGTCHGLPRYGHGFSKLLPMLTDLLTPSHRRTHSDFRQTCSTDRMRPTYSRAPTSNRTPLI